MMLPIRSHRSGNRVLSYCFMSNPIHLLLEIIPAPADGLTDEELLRRLRAINSEAQVAEVAKELADARKAVGEGHADESRVAAIHARFTYRMHDLGKALNHRHEIRNEEVAGRWKMVAKE